MSPVCCAICAAPLRLPWACQQAHPDHCDDCYRRNLARSFDAREHPAPDETLVLTPRDVQALVAYQERLARLRQQEETP
jgi:hypothetical protein